FHHRAIVPGSHYDPRITIKPGENLCEQFVFAEFAQRPCHGCNISGKASARRVMALKMACIVIENNNDPPHSYARAKQIQRAKSRQNNGRGKGTAEKISAET